MGTGQTANTRYLLPWPPATLNTSTLFDLSWAAIMGMEPFFRPYKDFTDVWRQVTGDGAHVECLLCHPDTRVFNGHVTRDTRHHDTGPKQVSKDRHC